VTGPQLRQRFGLDDTWATFTYITSAIKKPADQQPSDPSHADDPSGGTSPDGGSVDTTGGQAAMAARRAPSVLAGRMSGVRRGATIGLERGDGGRWHLVGHARIGAHGRYRAPLPGPGRYRVVWGK